MSYIERYTDASGDLFIKYPLINNLLNDRGWRTTAEANAAYARTVIGTAFALMPNPDEAKYGDGHPFRKTETADIKEEIDYAFQYAIGQNVGVTTESGQYKGASGEIPYFGIARITDPDAKIELQKADSTLMPKAVSAGIIQQEGPDNAITKYHIVHVAAVTKGAYGPKFVHLAKCNGDALSCLPALKAASYKERNHICPRQVLSSYAQKSGSSDVKIMSAVNNASTPGPQSFGTGTISTSYPDQQQSAPVKPTIRIKKRNPNANGLGLESEEPEKGEEETQPQPEGEQPNNNNTNNIENPQASVASVTKELAQLKKQYETQANVWKQDSMRRELQDAIPKSLFTDQKGRFREKDWQREVDARLQQGLPIETIREIYQLKVQMLEVPEIAVRGQSQSKRASSLPTSKGASSQYDAEDEERRMKLNELGRMIRGH